MGFWINVESDASKAIIDLAFIYSDLADIDLSEMEALEIEALSDFCRDVQADDDRPIGKCVK